MGAAIVAPAPRMAPNNGLWIMYELGSGVGHVAKTRKVRRTEGPSDHWTSSYSVPRTSQSPSHARIFLHDTSIFVPIVRLSSSILRFAPNLREPTWSRSHSCTLSESTHAPE